MLDEARPDLFPFEVACLQLVYSIGMRVRVGPLGQHHHEAEGFRGVLQQPLHMAQRGLRQRLAARRMRYQRPRHWSELQKRPGCPDHSFSINNILKNRYEEIQTGKSNKNGSKKLEKSDVIISLLRQSVILIMS